MALGGIARHTKAVVPALAALAWTPHTACAQDGEPSGPTRSHATPAPDAQPDEKQIIVFGRGTPRIGIAQAASEGSVSGSDLLVRPLLRTAELLEAVPGMVAAQHSGSGKANQYFLRGFNLDHGSDFTTYLDNVQMNLRSHGHGQGYLDLNGLIPETVGREDFRKGPYRADGGDFALAGAAYMTTIDSYDRPWISLEGGSYDHLRAAAGGSTDMGQGQLTTVGEVRTYNGPWQQPERLRHFAGFGKFTQPTGAGTLAISAHLYRGTWRPTEQIPERIIGSPLCPDVFCSPDPTATGQTTRVLLNAQLAGDTGRANVYGQYYAWDMFSNPEYFDSTGTSAQIHQIDHRIMFGGSGERRWQIGSATRLTAGAQVQYDRATKVGVERSIARVPAGSLGFYKINELSAAGYLSAEWKPADRLRLIAGARADHFRFAVTPLDAAAEALGAGSGSKTLVSPKAQLAFVIAPPVELYAAWGRGFHSNDVRGAVTTTPVPLLVPGTGKELGIRFERGTVSATFTYWWLSVGSELKFVGDSNSVEPTDPSRRRGWEVVGFWRPRPWLALDGTFTFSRARYTNGSFISNSFENAGSAGISIVTHNWEASARVRHLGPYPLLDDNSLRDSGSTVINARAARKFGRVQVYGEVLNVLDSRDKDIAYYYQSYLPAFDAAPVEGRLSRTLEPRTVRLGLRVEL